MKNIFLFIVVFTISSNALLSQSIEEYNKKIDSLNAVVKEVDIEISELNKRKTEIKEILRTVIQERNSLEFESQLIEGIPITLNAFGGRLRDEPDTNGKVLIEIPRGEKVLVYDWYKRPYFKASYKGKIGYISFSSLNVNYQLKSIINKDLAENNPELERLTKMFGSDAAKKILRKEYWIGMTDEMAKVSLGFPDDINRTIGTWGTQEQWIYSKKDLYLYFLNGELTTIQE
jgi:hypothetical protein